mmetsp:Transcript_35047/g.64518  ORF Transcript_35047/g.64518 Transcript_35047/m.64518 type:complete len:279 (-) Transcript_35047:112-948(-)
MQLSSWILEHQAAQGKHFLAALRQGQRHHSCSDLHLTHHQSRRMINSECRQLTSIYLLRPDGDSSSVCLVSRIQPAAASTCLASHCSVPHHQAPAGLCRQTFLAHLRSRLLPLSGHVFSVTLGCRLETLGSRYHHSKSSESPMNHEKILASAAWRSPARIKGLLPPALAFHVDWEAALVLNLTVASQPSASRSKPALSDRRCGAWHRASSVFVLARQTQLHLPKEEEPHASTEGLFPMARHWHHCRARVHLGRVCSEPVERSCLHQTCPCGSCTRQHI